MPESSPTSAKGISSTVAPFAAFGSQLWERPIDFRTTGPQPRYWSGDFEPDRIVESHLQGSKPNTRVSTKEPADNTTTTLVDLATSAITSDTNPADSPSSGFKTPTPMAESPSGWDQPVNLGSPHPVLVPDGEWRPELLHASYDIETWRQASAQASSADPNEFVDNIKDEEGYHGENRIVEAGFPGSAQKKQIAAITDSTVGTGDDKVGQKPGAELGDDVLQMSSSRESESRSQPVMVPPQENNTTTVSTAAIDGVIRSPVVQCATSQLQPQPKSTTNLTTQLAAMNGSFQDSNGDEQSDASEVKLIEVGNSPKQFSDTSLKNHHPNLQDDIFSSLEDGQLALDLGPPLLDVPGTAASQPSHAGKRENDTTATDDCTATGNAQVGDLSSHPESGVSSRHDPTVAVNHGSIGADAAASSSSNLAPKRLLTLMDSNWSKSRQISQQRPQPVRHVRHQQVHLAQDQWQQWQAPHGQHMALQHPGYIRPTQAIIHFPHHPPPPPLLPPPPPQVMVWSHPSVLPRKEVPQGHQIRVSNHPIHSFTHELYEGDDVKAASLVCSRCQASMSEAEATATIATTTRTTLSPPVTFSSSSLTVDPTGDGSNQGTGSNLAVPERRRYDREFLMKFANIKNTAIPVPLQDCIETSQSESDEQKERGERTEESGDQAVVTAMLDTEANKKAEAIAEPAAALVKDGGHVDSKLASTLRARGYIRQPVGPNSLEDKGFRTYRRGNSF
ncbi:hypothetical protein BGZ73_006524 [Actinomortierella ambigua]|nr:hypothetical protein BGZ73_006524 [Actinomortierella ambigua]